MSKLNIYFDDSPAVSAMQLRTKCRRLYREHGLDLIIVDYLQLMNAGTTVGRDTNRVQEITYISRSLKELARELNVPLLSAAQLSRAVEQRQDKRPQLSDLRESGCLTGDTLVTLAETGRRVPIHDLAGQAGFDVWALDENSLKLERAAVSRAFSTGTKPVYRLTTRLGRTIRATANHKFLTIHG
jgi:replicative DNA helicase